MVLTVWVFYELAIPSFQKLLARDPVCFLFSLSHPAASLIHIDSPPTGASVHLSQLFPELLLIIISGEKCSQSASKCSNCGLRQTCSSGVDVCWAVSTQALRATHPPNSENVFPRTAGNTLMGSLCFFINIVSIPVFKEKRWKGFPQDRILNSTHCFLCLTDAILAPVPVLCLKLPPLGWHFCLNWTPIIKVYPVCDNHQAVYLWLVCFSAYSSMKHLCVTFKAAEGSAWILRVISFIGITAEKDGF